MGIYDRDYGRDDLQPGVHLSSPKTVTTMLVLVTVAVYGLQIVFGPKFVGTFSLDSDWYTRPWQVFQLLSYGFLHSPLGVQHIFWNMFALWLFGRDVEYRYGRREYVAFYLAAIVFSGIVWTIFSSVSGTPAAMLGASGGISAVLILFAFNYPKRTVLMMFVIPMPMWVLACIIVGMDIMGAMGSPALNRGGNVAFTAHLGGALFAYLYFRGGWKLENWLPSNLSLPRPRKKSSLRIHDPEDASQETNEQVDEILKKIQEHGQDSLTRRERRILEKASKEYQRKRQ